MPGQHLICSNYTYFSLRFTLTVEAEGVKHGFCPMGAAESGGTGELSVVGLKFVEPKEKEAAEVAMGPAEREGVVEALEEADEKENAAAPVKPAPGACLDTSDAKGYGGGSPDVEPDAFTVEGVKEKVAAAPPAGGRVEAKEAEAIAGVASSFEVGEVVGVVAVLPGET